MVAYLLAALSPAGQVHGATSQRCAVAAWESSIWPGPSIDFQDKGGAVTAGDPVVRLASESIGRAASVALIRDRLLVEGEALLRSAEGSYATAAWDVMGRALVCTDKLGIRPIYWAQVGDLVLASSTFWALERLDCIPAPRTCGESLSPRSLVPHWPIELSALQYTFWVLAKSWTCEVTLHVSTPTGTGHT